jgi:hypothetical protein
MEQCPWRRRGRKSHPPLDKATAHDAKLLYARIPGNRLKVQFGVLFPIPQLAFAGNHSKRVKEEGKSTPEITRKEIRGVPYSVQVRAWYQTYMREKLFSQLQN